MYLYQAVARGGIKALMTLLHIVMGMSATVAVATDSIYIESRPARGSGTGMTVEGAGGAH